MSSLEVNTFPELDKINYIQKPIENEELVQIVDTIIGRTATTIQKR
jgi:hypothetical protein